MNFRTSGHGRSLYWLTAPITLNGRAQGVFMLDTGSDATVTTLTCGSHRQNPRTLHFGSGSVTGYPQPVLVPLPPHSGAEDLRGEIVHSAFDLPFDDEVQGVLGLLPDAKGEGLITYPRITSVELDFRTNTLHFNREQSVYGPSPQAARLSGSFRHPVMPEKPWLQGQIALVDSQGTRRELPSDERWLMLDTGATTAVTFLTRDLDPLPCDPEGRDLQTVEIRLRGSRDWVACPVPVRTLWPSCVDVDADPHGVVVLGIQFLYYPFRSLRYRVGPAHGQVSDVALF